jgi:hypothetical protein
MKTSILLFIIFIVAIAVWAFNDSNLYPVEAATLIMAAVMLVIAAYLSGENYWTEALMLVYCCLLTLLFGTALSYATGVSLIYEYTVYSLCGVAFLYLFAFLGRETHWANRSLFFAQTFVSRY